MKKLIRFIASIEVELNDTPESEIVENIQAVVDAARADGRITGSTDAELVTLESEGHVVIDGQCVHCGSGSYSGESFDVDGLNVSQECNCVDCGSSWIDVYGLIRQDVQNGAQ